MYQLNAILTIAFRDFTKLLRDRTRLLISFIFPLLFVGIFGGSAQSNLGQYVAFNFMTFVFTGVIAQVLFQSTASGVTFLLEDRENDFSQEIFVSPISRYSIIFGKILGESMVSYIQVLGVVLFALIARIPMEPLQLLTILVAGIIPCLLGGAFGVLVLAIMSNQRQAGQLFPLLIFPQFFLAGVFNPITNLDSILFVLSRIVPMTYAVDFIRGIFYWGKSEYKEVVLYHPLVDLAIMSVMFVVMISIGTYFFVKNERNK